MEPGPWLDGRRFNSVTGFMGGPRVDRPHYDPREFGGPWYGWRRAEFEEELEGYSPRSVGEVEMAPLWDIPACLVSAFLFVGVVLSLDSDAYFEWVDGSVWNRWTEVGTVGLVREFLE